MGYWMGKIFISFSRWWSRMAFLIRPLFLGKRFPGYFSMKHLGASVLPQRKISSTDKVVVVGIGVAAFTVVKELAARGFKNITVVCKDEHFGGLCVNWGCMPSEFFFHSVQIPVEKRTEALKAFVSQLGYFTKTAFQGHAQKIIPGEVLEIQNKELILKNGNRIGFDHLFWAGGLDFEAHSFGIDLKKFWDLKSGASLQIFTEANPLALSLADLAVEKGLKVSLFHKENFRFSHLESFQYFIETIRNRGVAIQKVRRWKEEESVIRIQSNDSEVSEFLLENSMWVSSPTPCLPKVDGVHSTIADLNPDSFSLFRRSDITCIGDAAGMMGASEGEFGAKILIRILCDGDKLFFHDYWQKLPYRLHAHSSWAWTGSASSLLETSLESVDFSTLGVSLITQEYGKLWYQLDLKTGIIQSLQICHPKAGDLISFASHLMQYPVTDPLWQLGSVHPSVFEIFKVVADKAMKRLGDVEGEQIWPADVKVSNIRLKKDELGDLSFLKPEEYRSMLLSEDPASRITVIKALRKRAHARETDPLEGVFSRGSHPCELLYSKSKSPILFSNMDARGRLKILWEDELLLAEVQLP